MAITIRSRIMQQLRSLRNRFAKQASAESKQSDFLCNMTDNRTGEVTKHFVRFSADRKVGVVLPAGVIPPGTTPIDYAPNHS